MSHFFPSSDNTLLPDIEYYDYSKILFHTFHANLIGDVLCHTAASYSTQPPSQVYVSIL